MTLFVLDTDHLSLYGRNQPQVIARLRVNWEQVATTAINVEEQLRGRLAQIAEAKKSEALSNAYQRLGETVMLLSEFQVLPYNADAIAIYQALKALKIRVGTQDLRIASVTLAHNGTLVTRNLQDFQKVPNLTIEDWSY
ncbi:type II toxin-antitoxin system VapC family toxin [Aliterella atlantica]|uniref:Nucleic acid-binding protein, contains PIN domain protein n=1 Tax=Aliterella atlantica CENA595 TaxID=1618023 RepID=A0A0D8ZLZ9_9CYAN|nr:type II toxin-antitoxin system VapC family toxin [Aliterella atlantica]KJH69755.1 nucleic acid-binding protein, contains PIN domain protein [Aliterella atlantica CENA595]